MAIATVIGSALIAFGPSFVLFLRFILLRPVNVVIFTASALAWIISLLISSLVWYAVVPLWNVPAFSLVFAVIFQEMMRVALFYLMRKADSGLLLMANRANEADEDAQSVRNSDENLPLDAKQQEVAPLNPDQRSQQQQQVLHNNGNNSQQQTQQQQQQQMELIPHEEQQAQAEQEVRVRHEQQNQVGGEVRVIGGSGRFSDAPPIAQKIFDMFELSYVVGLGYGITSGLLSMSNLLILASGPATIGFTSIQRNFLMYSSLQTCCNVIKHTAWNIVLFRAMLRKHYVAALIPLLLHMAASCSSLANNSGSPAAETVLAFDFLIGGASVLLVYWKFLPRGMRFVFRLPDWSSLKLF